jgi:Fe-S-cluster containining protein
MTIENAVSSIDYKVYMEELKNLFCDMDDAYEDVAKQYGFVCRGCNDNCCYSTFYHHTLLEYLYFKEGLRALEEGERQQILDAAGIALEKKESGEKVMCPANKNGLCKVYEYRPMVCRMHGLAHELKRPGQDAVRSPGCDFFTDLVKGGDYIQFDRTVFYVRMAELEKRIRLDSGYMGKIKYTIAEMILK